MTPQESQNARLTGFIQEYNALREKYGYYLEAVGTSDAQGMVHISTMRLDIRALPNWQPPQVEPHSHEVKPGTPGVTSFVDPLTLERPAKAFANGGEPGRFEE